MLGKLGKLGKLSCEAGFREPTGRKPGIYAFSFPNFPTFSPLTTEYYPMTDIRKRYRTPKPELAPSPYPAGRADWKELRSTDQRAPTGAGGGRKGTPNDHTNDR
jgi:hypothetical protein